MEVCLRLALEEELASLLPLVEAYHAFEQLSTEAKQREGAVLRLLREPSLGRIWFVEVESELAGYVVLCRGFSIEFGGFDAFVDEFYLLPTFRGRGVGLQVLQMLRQEAEALDIRAVHLEVGRDNVRARKLYANAGFAAREKFVLMSTLLGEK